MSIEKFSVEKVLSVHRWAHNLFSFTMTRPAHFKFTAGQFARIGLMIGDELVVRAYSVVSSPFDETLEFFSIVVPDGAFTSNLQHLKVGDELYLEKISNSNLNCSGKVGKTSSSFSCASIFPNPCTTIIPLPLGEKFGTNIINCSNS